MLALRRLKGHPYQYTHQLAALQDGGLPHLLLTSPLLSSTSRISARPLHKSSPTAQIPGDPIVQERLKLWEEEKHRQQEEEIKAKQGTRSSENLIEVELVLPLAEGSLSFQVRTCARCLGVV